MAVTETVKIVFEVDNKAITDTVADLAALGKVSQEDAAKFKQLSDASKAASKDLAAVGKSAESITDVAIAVKDVGDSFTPLSKQIKIAKDELQRLSDEFGEESTQATNAAQSLAVLTKQSEDLGKKVNLLKPENQIAAFEKLGSAVLGSFQIATGALQAFGAENEQVEAVAKRLQGALNVVQGVKSIVDLKETYKDVKQVLGLTTVAQTTLTTATTAGKVATDGAALSTRGFAAALTSTGIGAIVVALGALIGAYIAYTSTGDDAIDTNEALKDSNDALANSTDEVLDSTLRLKVAQGELTSQRAKIIQQRQQESDSVKPLIAKNKELAASIEDSQKLIDELLARGVKTTDPGGNILAGLQSEVDKVKKVIQANEQAINNIRRDGKNERKLLEQEEAQDKQDQLEKDQDARNKAAEQARQANREALQKRIEDAKSAFEEERKAREDSLDLNRLMGATEEDILRQKQFNIQADIDGLQKVADLAQGTEQYKQLLSQINDLKREQVKIDVQLQNALQIEKAPEGFKKLEQAVEDVITQLNKLEPIKIPVEAPGFDEIIAKEEALKKKRNETAQFTIDKAGELTDFLIQEGNRETEERIARLDEQREAGLISEEAYQAGLKKIKQKNAEDNKKFQVFLALLQSAQAILTALQTPPNPLDPTAQIRAVTFASVTAAINLAKILATPVPKFKDGTLSVPGQDHGRDSVYAMLRPGEAVIPTETNRMYAPTIEAIYRKRVKASEINAFVLNRMTGKGSIGRDTAITASVDTFALGRVMSKQKTVEVGNANIVGKAIAGEIMKAYNPRRS